MDFLGLGVLLLQGVSSQMSNYLDEKDIYGSTSITTTGQTNCHALLACADITTMNVNSASYTGGNYLQCSGTRSCQDISTLTVEGNIRANGFMSLFGINSLSVGDTIDCWGEASCSKINEINVVNLECDGLNSCKNLYISEEESTSGSSIEELIANGMFSFQNSEIYSNGDISENNYEFRGWYSGYGSTIYCQNGHTCNILCKNNGCVGLTVSCDSGSTCTYDCDDNNGHPCPTTTTDYANDNYGLFDVFTEYYLRDYDVTDEDDDNLFGCSSTYSDYSSCNDYQDSNCRSGTLSISSNKNICCRGVYSCQSSNINIDGEDGNVYCTSGYSCVSATISLSDGVTSTSNVIECGRQSCQSSTIDSISSVIANGYRALRYSSINNPSFLGCFSTLGCQSTNIYDGELIYGTGYQSLYSATIDNSNLESFEIYLLGDDSGNSLNIYCDNDILVECNIYCYNEETCNNLGSVTCDCNYIYINSKTECNGCSSGGYVEDGDCYELSDTSNNLYGCYGTFSGGLDDSSADALCGDGYHVCSSAEEASSLGLTKDMCVSVGINEIFLARESSNGIGKCESVYPSNSGSNDVWGCSGAIDESDSDSSYFYDGKCLYIDDTSFPQCYTLTHFCGYWTGRDGYNDNTILDLGTDGNNEYNNVAINDASSGGVLCCAD